MDEVADVLNFIWTKGVIGAIVVLLVLIVHDPDRAEKLKEIIFLPAFRFFKRGSRQYMSAKVGYASTQFIKRELLPFLPATANVKVTIKWVKSPSDPILTENGNLILCLRETDDQTRNVLAATQAALPRIVCTSLRAYVHPDLMDAVDLTLLKKLTNALGRYAQPVFQRYFVGSRADDSGNLRRLFSQLVELDTHGTFVSIFLEELDSLGERLFAVANGRDHTTDITQFLDFLLVEARRQEHQEIRLDYFSSTFSIGIIILAASVKMQREGVSPYVKRIDQKIKQGCDSIYIISYQKASRFLDKLLKVVESDNRYVLAKRATPSIPNSITGRREELFIAQLKRNTLFADADFAQRVEANNIHAGDKVEGQVIDVSDTQAYVDILGLNAVIQREDCGWQKVRNCGDVLECGERKEFMLKAVDSEKGHLILSLRFPNTDPWAITAVPQKGQKVQVLVVSRNGSEYYCKTTSGVEIVLPNYEVSWLEQYCDTDNNLIGQLVDIVVTDRDDSTRLIKGSMRQLVDNPWPLIQKKWPKGTKLRGIVVAVDEHFVRVKLPEELTGSLPDTALRAAGYELADFTKTVVLGQGLDVVVSRIFSERQRIRLDLQRNRGEGNTVK